jgi:hypothetical protein
VFQGTRPGLLPARLRTRGKLLTTPIGPTDRRDGFTARIRALAVELADVEAASLSSSEKREVRHLYEILARLR